MRVGIALGGGGVRGLAHILVLQVLDDLHIRPAVISGASMGAHYRRSVRIRYFRKRGQSDYREAHYSQK